MPNIKDVANLAGVSVATVSRFLNEKGNVSEKSKQKIKQAITRLNYRPNLLARSLSTKQGNTIGLILPDITNPFFSELARAIEDVCIDKGYTIVLGNTDYEVQKERHYVELFLQKYVAGLIVTTGLLKREEYEALTIPIVGLDIVQNSPFPIITTDNRLGGRLAAEALLSTGCKHVLILAGPQNSYAASERVKGFLMYADLVKEVHVEVVSSYMNYKKTHDLVRTILKNKQVIDGIFACSDMDGIAAIKAATALRYNIPEVLQVIGFGGLSVGELTSPSLTTIAQNIYQLGELAAEQLISKIEGKEIARAQVMISPQLLVRESTRRS